jgi:UDP-glucuronate decarboxylase
MTLERKRVLVTGGAGFLGSHLCEALLAEGADVLCVDNYFTGPTSRICSTTRISRRCATT